MAAVARVALPRPVRRFFDYTIPDGMELAIGTRVSVPFGNRREFAIVVKLNPEDTPAVALKSIERILDTTPALPQETVQFLLWAANYYLHPPGQCLFSALAPPLRKNAAPRTPPVPCWKLAPEADMDVLSQRAHRQRELLEWLAQTKIATTLELQQAGFSSEIIRTLVNKGLLSPAAQGEDFVPVPDLNPQQQDVFDALPESIDHYAAHLIYGITGSGKTELYMKYLEARLPKQAQALVLVPEINLTPQTVSRFKRHFGSRIAAWHSGLSNGERLQIWQNIRDGDPCIVIGTRSAVLLPFVKLKTIVIDEEHDSSYKQHEGFRYSARDLAVMRAYQTPCPVLLGSATPSLESLHNAHAGRYDIHRLMQRAGAGRPPHIELLDIRSRPLEAGISAPLLDAIRHHLEEGGQVLVYLNRRGYAPVLMCYNCKHLMECPHCDAKLAWHKGANALRCHHCLHAEPTPQHCPACQEDQLNPVGQGTERTEEYLSGVFPDTPLLRIDRDSTRRKNALEEKLEIINSGAPCIMVGTQMLTKGHDFPNVTLVAVLNADSALYCADYRAPENLVQSLTQVAGRAGRSRKAGRVIIQTLNTDNDYLQAIAKGDYESTSNQLLSERRQLDLPPFSHHALIKMESPTATRSMNALTELKEALNTTNNPPSLYTIMGPMPTQIARKAGKHRAQLLLASRDRKTLHRICKQAIQRLETTKSQPSWFIDIDPITIE
ncbi:primosomal protein N' [Marinobacteraceae bacterium S3BR75-40.1]